MQAQTDSTLVSNTGQEASSQVAVGGPFEYTKAQQFTTGDNEGGYTLSEVVIRFESIWSDAVPKVSIYTDLSGNPGASLYGLTNPSALVANSENTFTAPADATLEKETDYFVVIESEDPSRQFAVKSGNANTEDSGAASGWSIGNNRHIRQPGTDWRTSNSELRIAIKGRANTVDINAATGKPAIAGTANVGQTLAASTSGISDANGKTKADNGDAGYAWTYQWIRVDGADEAGISGATLSTYTLVADDLGKKVKVKVSFTDDADNDEGPLTSDAWPTAGTIAAAANNAATGKPTIAGTAIVGETLTASTSGISDSDGKTKADNGGRGLRLDLPVDPGGWRERSEYPGGGFRHIRIGARRPGQEGQGRSGFHRRWGPQRIADQRRLASDRDNRGDRRCDPEGVGSSITLGPSFNPATFEYAGTVANYVSRATFRPETNESGATLTFLDANDTPIADASLTGSGHQVSLATGDNVIKVKVTAEAGATRTYRVTITGGRSRGYG